MTRILHLATIFACGVVVTTACTEPEPTKPLPPPGMAGAPTAMGNHGAILPGATMPAQTNPGVNPAAAPANPHGGMAASQPSTATPNFPTIVPGSGAPPGEMGHQEPTHAGVVVESMDAADYTYMRIKKDDGKEEWTATTRTEVKVGDRVIVAESLVMHDFQSKSLNRTFPRIIFGTRK